MNIISNFYNRSDALAIEPSTHIAVISVTDARKTTPKFSNDFLDITYLKFDDFEKVMFDEVLIDDDDAKQIINFVRGLKDSNCNRLVVHCEYGRSRSVAICAALKTLFTINCEQPFPPNYNQLVYSKLLNNF